jgi:hypothetical protein
MGAAIGLFVQNMGANMDLFQAILKHTKRDGEPLSNGFAFDSAYQGNYKELFAAVVWSVKENFGNMLGASQFPFAQGALSAKSQKED